MTQHKTWQLWRDEKMIDEEAGVRGPICRVINEEHRARASFRPRSLFDSPTRSPILYLWSWRQNVWNELA